MCKLIKTLVIISLLGLTLFSPFAGSAFSTPTKADQDLSQLTDSLNGYDDLKLNGLIPEEYTQLVNHEDLTYEQLNQLKFLGFQLFSEHSKYTCVLSGSYAISFWVNYYNSHYSENIEYRRPNDLDILANMDHHVSLARFFPDAFIEGRDNGNTVIAEVDRCHLKGKPGYFGMDILDKRSQFGFDSYDDFKFYIDESGNSNHYPILPPHILLHQKRLQLEAFDSGDKECSAEKRSNTVFDINLLEFLISLEG